MSTASWALISVVEVLPAPRDGAQGVLGRGVTLVTAPGRSPAQRWISAIFDNGSSCSRSSGGAVTSSAFSVIIAAVRALTATSLATLIWRIISTVPSAVFGTAVAVPASAARAAFSASRVSDLPRSRRSRRSVRITSTTPMPRRRTALVSPAP